MTAKGTWCMFKIANDIPSLACLYYYCAKFMTLREKNNFQHYIGGQPFMKDPKLWSLPQINFAF